MTTVTDRRRLELSELLGYCCSILARRCRGEMLEEELELFTNGVEGCHVLDAILVGDQFELPGEKPNDAAELLRLLFYRIREKVLPAVGFLGENEIDEEGREGRSHLAHCAEEVLIVKLLAAFWRELAPFEFERLHIGGACHKAFEFCEQLAFKSQQPVSQADHAPLIDGVKTEFLACREENTVELPN